MILQGNDPATEPSFGLKNRLARLLWGVVWALLFQTSPRPAHVWRRFLLKLFGAKLGKHVHVYPGVRIWAPWQLSIGDRVGVADGVVLYNMAPINIGNQTTISQGAHLCAGSHDINSPNFQLIAKPIVLGANVWVCAEAFIGPGVTVSDGCVLAARSVVVKNVAAAWTVWAGNPAQLKKQRLQRN